MPAGTYAKTTEVPVDRSKAELERVLQRYGADAFGYINDAGRVMVMFRIHNLKVSMALPMPSREDPAFTRMANGYTRRSDTSAQKLWEQTVRQRWRVLVLVVKAKLEAIEVGISTVEREFLADIALPEGDTLGERLLPRINALANGEPLALVSHEVRHGQ